MYTESDDKKGRPTFHEKKKVHHQTENPGYACGSNSFFLP